jgi:cytochrome P450
MELSTRSHADLRHIPGDDGLPVFGHTFAYLSDPSGWIRQRHRRYGPVFRTKVFFEGGVGISGPDFAERFFLDKDQVFSSAYGWRNVLGDFFGGGLMLRDFADHRIHRRVMQAAFRPEALDSYLEVLGKLQTRFVDALAEGPLMAYPWLKQLMLDGAAAVFLGLDLGEDAHRVSRWFLEITAGVAAPLRFDVPGTTYGRAVRAKRSVRRYLASLIPARRRTGGSDMFSILCRATSEEGERFSDEEIVAHMLFLLVAAHDTTTSALTNMLFELGRRPELQAELRRECEGQSDLAKLAGVDNCFREVLRLYAPVRSIPRRTVREIEVHGHRVPANAQVWVTPDVNHRDPAIWTDADAFDPSRFTEPRAEHRKHRFAYIPFGGGAHTCIGMQFSELQVRSLMHALLRRFEWRVADRGARKMQFLPFPKPKDGLPLILRRI